MKQILFLAMILIASLYANVAYAATPSHVVGRILLQVEEHGEAWYVAPQSQERLYIRNGDAAYAALRTFGLGITSSDLEKIPVGIEDRFEDIDTDGDGLADKLEEALGTNASDTDSDNDGYADGVEVEGGYNPRGSGLVNRDTNLSERLKGYILLQVQSRGEAWYVHPSDGKRYYMKDGDAAYQIMRYLSLGITNANLAGIPLLSSELDCGENYDCLIGALQSGVAGSATVESSMNLSPVFDVAIETTSRMTHALRNSAGLYAFEIETLHQSANGKTANEVMGARLVCTYADINDMIAVLEDWKVGTSSTDQMDFATCETIEP